MSAKTPAAGIEGRLRRMLEYIHDNLDGDLSLDALAEVACLSRFHCHRVFRAMTGETPAEAIRRIRLLKAANALVREDAPIAEVAARFGYPNAASFSRAFTAQHGSSPAAFRAAGVSIVNQLRRKERDNAVYPVIIEDLPPARAAGVPHRGAYPEIARAFQTLGGIIGARNLYPHASGMAAIYHDAPGSRPDAELRSHAVVLIDKDFPEGIEGLEYFDLVGGRHAVLQHKGPYATLGAAYDWLFGQWLPDSGEEPRDAPPVELYVNDPRTTPPEALRTDIRLPIV